VVGRRASFLSAKTWQEDVGLNAAKTFVEGVVISECGKHLHARGENRVLHRDRGN
jgi:hypothetical protein